MTLYGNTRLVPPRGSRAWRDDLFERAALSASALCLIHCLALPLLLAALPALSSVLDIPEAFHIWILLFAVPASSIALITGRARHGATLPLLLGVAGMACLAAGALLFLTTPAETPLTVVGSLSLAAAHILNWRLRHAGHAHG